MGWISLRFKQDSIPTPPFAPYGERSNPMKFESHEKTVSPINARLKRCRRPRSSAPPGSEHGTGCTNRDRARLTPLTGSLDLHPVHPRGDADWFLISPARPRIPRAKKKRNFRTAPDPDTLLLRRRGRIPVELILKGLAFRSFHAGTAFFRRFTKGRAGAQQTQKI